MRGDDCFDIGSKARPEIGDGAHARRIGIVRRAADDARPCPDGVEDLGRGRIERDDARRRRARPERVAEVVGKWRANGSRFARAREQRCGGQREPPDSSAMTGEKHDGHLPSERVPVTDAFAVDEARGVTSPPPRTCERIASRVVSWLRAAPPAFPTAVSGLCEGARANARYSGGAGPAPKPRPYPPPRPLVLRAIRRRGLPRRWRLPDFPPQH